LAGVAAFFFVSASKNRLTAARKKVYLDSFSLINSVMIPN
jgi:hypothetical protein